MADDGMIRGSDETELGANKRLLQHGRAVPQDVSLIGLQHQIDRSAADHLTCVFADGVEVGRQLAKTAIKQIESRGEDLSEVATVLVKRGPCRPLRGEEPMVL
jgi:DNA-binding LacI/PurR family transcriptional regulator